MGEIPGVVEIPSGEHRGIRDKNGKAVKFTKAIELTAARVNNPSNRGIMKFYFLDGKRWVQILDQDAASKAFDSVEFEFGGDLPLDHKQLIKASEWFGLKPDQIKSIILGHAPKKK